MTENSIAFRLLTREDGENIYTLSGNEVVSRYMRFDTHTSVEQAEALLQEYIDQAGVAVEVDGSFAGIFSFNKNSNDDYGMSTFLGEKYWSKGYSTYILKTMISYAKENLQAKSLSAYVVMDNLGSRRVLEKNGFKVIKKA